MSKETEEERKKRFKKSLLKMIREEEDKRSLFSGGMEEYADKVLSTLTEESPYVGSEDFKYHSDDLSVSKKEFDLLFEYLNDYARWAKKISHQEDEDFYNYAFWFRYKGKIYEGYHVSGQGSDDSISLTTRFKRGMLFEFSHAKTYWQN